MSTTQTPFCQEQTSVKMIEAIWNFLLQKKTLLPLVPVIKQYWIIWHYRIHSWKCHTFFIQNFDKKLECVLITWRTKLSKFFSEYFQIQFTHDDLFNVRHFENQTGSLIAGLIQAPVTLVENLQSSLSLNSFTQQLYWMLNKMKS